MLYILAVARAPVGLDGDWHFYSSAALYIAQGRFLYRGIFHHAYLTAEHPPLYPLLLGAVAWLGGVSVEAQRAVGCVVGTVAVVLFGVVGRRLGGERAGLTAAGLAAVYPPLIVVDGSLMSEPLLVVGLLVVLMLAYRLHEQPSVGRACALGGALGLTILAHSESLLLVPLLLIPAAWGPPSGRAVRVAGALLSCLLVLAPWLIRNEVDFHRLTLSTNTNTVIAGANCRQTYYGHDIGWWSLACDAKKRTFAELVEGSANVGPALHYVSHHVARAGLVAVVRVLRTFSFFQPLREGNGQIRVRWVDVAGLAIYYPLLLLAGLGLWRWRDGRRWPLASLILLAVLVSATDSGLPRLRIPADVGLLLLAGLALSSARRPGLRGPPGAP